MKGIKSDLIKTRRRYLALLVFQQQVEQILQFPLILSQLVLNILTFPQFLILLLELVSFLQNTLLLF
jgi:hypothetical protein